MCHRRPLKGGESSAEIGRLVQVTTRLFREDRLNFHLPCEEDFLVDARSAILEVEQTPNRMKFSNSLFLLAFRIGYFKRVEYAGLSMLLIYFIHK